MMQSMITIMMHSSILARAGGVKMGGFAPKPPTLSSELFASVLPPVANLRLWWGIPPHPPSSIVKSYEHVWSYVDFWSSNTNGS